MPESKRIFNAGKMNRDLDDRLVPPGEYRDALNVGIGRSEGSDVGAVENLKGNMSINPDTLVVSGTNVTTIGVVRDPHNDRIYWLNTGGGYDAIYEYDESTGNITPIISEPTNRTATLPTCAPDLLSRITEPMGNSGSRTPLRALPTPPSPVCNLPTGPNGRPNTNYVASPSSSQYVDNDTCVEEDPPPTPATNPVAAITGPTVGTTGGTAVQLSGATSTPGTAAGGTAATITSYAWSTDDGQSGTGTTFDVTARSTDGDIVVTLLITNSEGATDDATHTITYSTTPPTVSAFSLAVTDTIANATSAGNVSDMRAEGATINQAVGITPDSGYEWVDQTALRAALTGTTGDIQLNYTNGSETGTVTGTMPAGTVSLSVVFSGATTQLIPAATSDYSIRVTTNDVFNILVRGHKEIEVFGREYSADGSTLIRSFTVGSDDTGATDPTIDTGALSFSITAGNRFALLVRLEYATGDTIEDSQSFTDSPSGSFTARQFHSNTVQTFIWEIGGPNYNNPIADTGGTDYTLDITVTET